MSICTCIGNGTSTAQQIDATTSFADLLGVALHIRSIAHEAAIQYINGLVSNSISGRSAVHCLSHIQSYFFEIVKSRKSEDLSMLVNLVDKVACTCLDMMTAYEDGNGDMSRPPDSRRCITCMDLFPIVINVLHQVERSSVWHRAGRVDSDVSQRHGQLLDDFCSHPWPTQLVLPLASIINDLWIFLLPRHVHSLKVLPVPCVCRLVMMYLAIILFHHVDRCICVYSVCGLGR